MIDRAVAFDDFQALSPVLIDSVNRLAKAGADFAIIPSNTMHVVFDAVAEQSPIPVLSILDVASDHCTKLAYGRVGILGTTPTVHRRLYDAPLYARGIATAYPSMSDQEAMMKIIHYELVRGIFIDESRQRLEDIAKRLAENCDAVVLGCTELPLVITEDACQTKLIDTTRILSHAALDEAVSGIAAASEEGQPNAAASRQ